MRHFGFSRDRHLGPVIALAIGLLAPTYVAKADHENAGMRVQLKDGPRLALRVTLTSAASKAVRVSRDELPWGTHDSMVIVAALAGGRCLDRIRPVEDAPFDEISLLPDQPVSREIDLEALFPNIRRALKESDVQLFWAYRAPETLHVPRWSGGWILIPKRP